MKAFRCVLSWICAFLLLTGVAATAESADRESDFFGGDQNTPEEIITSAMEIYSWFTISPLDVDPELPGGEGGVWQVADELLRDYGTVMRLLDFNFSPEIVEGLMEYEVYTVIDGVLYGTGGGRGVDARISEVTYEETYAGDDRIVYTVTVYYVGVADGEKNCEVLEFVREPVNGLWVFTQFPFFW